MKTILEHGETREDPYFWLREKENPEVEKYVREENAYYATVMDRLKDLKTDYFEKLKSRMEPEAIEVPYRHGPFRYGAYIPEGKEYAVYTRSKEESRSLHPADGVVWLDLNEVAKAHDYVSLGGFTPNDAHDLIAYTLDVEGNEIYRLHFISTDARPAPSEIIENVEGDIVYSKNGQYIFYVRLNDQHRPYQVWRHALRTPSTEDLLIFEEKDPRFFTSIQSSTDGEWIFIHLSSAESTEVRYARRGSEKNEAGGESPLFTVFLTRKGSHEYELDAQADRFIVLTNQDEPNFSLGSIPLTEIENGMKSWKPIVIGDARTDVRGFTVFKNHIAVLFAFDGVLGVRIFSQGESRGEKATYDLPFTETIRDVSFSANEEFNAKTIRLKYSSPRTPTQTIEYDLSSGHREVLHERIVHGFRPEDYAVERIEISAADGTKIPVSLIFREIDRGKKLPTLLYGYGSYGMVTPTGFSLLRSVIVDDGFLYAVAHVRGSGDLGQRWYKEGKFLKKKNTFTDFHDVAKALVTSGRTGAGNITLHGGSAGGLLVAATMNLEPSFFRGVIAEVPFVDVLSTMSDETLPLTPTEWDEWGDPRQLEFFRAMREYSPYDQLKAGEYPYLLVNGGWNDPRVTYWEPTKWVAKLRDLRTDDRLTILDIEMGAGHFGVTGRFAALEKPAEMIAFLHAIHFERERLNEN
ncbi:MAG: S9 family peptidase [Cryobacterium sp.]|nr:S9 family peptidase [Oligoflexia bacterium]